MVLLRQRQLLLIQISSPFTFIFNAFLIAELKHLFHVPAPTSGEQQLNPPFKCPMNNIFLCDGVVQ